MTISSYTYDFVCSSLRRHMKKRKGTASKKDMYNDLFSSASFEGWDGEYSVESEGERESECNQPVEPSSVRRAKGKQGQRFVRLISGEKREKWTVALTLCLPLFPCCLFECKKKRHSLRARLFCSHTGFYVQEEAVRASDLSQASSRILDVVFFFSSSSSEKSGSRFLLL